MPWMLQPHNYTQVIRPNLYNVDYRRVGAYKGMGGLNGFGAATCDPTDPLCGLSADWYSQLTGAMGPSAALTPLEQLQATQTQGQLFPSSLPTGQQAAAGVASAQLQAQLTQWLPWIAGGVLLFVLMRRR